VSESVMVSCCDAEQSQQQRWVTAVGVVKVGVHGGWGRGRWAADVQKITAALTAGFDWGRSSRNKKY